jgi:membrane protein DedA with SNARE-associated domain
MHGAVDFFIEQGSYGLMFAALVAAGMGVPLPEDIVFISGAILAQRGVTDLRLTCVVLGIGVFVGDTVLYTIARRIGPAIYERKFIKRVMPPERRAWFEEKIHKHGSLVVFCARHVAGLRGAIFAISAIHGISYPRFIIADMLALGVSMPLFMLLGWYFSTSIDTALTHAATAEHWVMIGIVSVLALIATVHGVRTWMKRRAEERAAAAAAPVAPEAGPDASA